ncbi:ArsR/SmtB family transcription factor [Kitasatospora sp. NPDC088346]|uniref:ArsR/SmtB family transcription factor n=1 Tax=Kitasatospora sp. NPDC088346 TaxID=3364073 RepID=UPI003814DC40
MPQPPLYQVKAEFFRMLGHPVRIRVLELLQGGPLPVRALLADIGVEPSNLSQQLAVLRRSGIVVSTREGPVVLYALAGGDVADLLRSARRILTVLLTDREGLLDQLREPDASAGTPADSDSDAETVAGPGAVSEWGVDEGAEPAVCSVLPEPR